MSPVMLIFIVGMGWVFFASTHRFLRVAHWAEPDWTLLVACLTLMFTSGLLLGSALEKVLP